MSQEYDAVFYEAFKEEAAVLESCLPKGHRYLFTWKTIQESGHESPPARVVSTRTQSKIPLEWASRLDGLLTRSTGYDHISDYLERCGAKLKAAYLPEYAARAVAEQAMILWSSCSRLLKLQISQFDSFLRDGLTGNEIKGKTIVVAGVGRIGSQVVDIAKGLGMDAIGIDIKPSSELERKYSLRYLSWEEALPLADVFVCALPLTSRTKGLLDMALLSKIKRGAIFVNISRGEISPSEILLKLLNDGVLAGVGLDVYDHEKEIAAILRDGKTRGEIPEAARPGVEAVLALRSHPRAILLPHNAFTPRSPSNGSRRRRPPT
jgi:D-lactate dehydrogenase